MKNINEHFDRLDYIKYCLQDGVLGQDIIASFGALLFPKFSNSSDVPIPDIVSNQHEGGINGKALESGDVVWPSIIPISEIFGESGLDDGQLTALLLNTWQSALDEQGFRDFEAVSSNEDDGWYVMIKYR